MTEALQLVVLFAAVMRLCRASDSACQDHHDSDAVVRCEQVSIKLYPDLNV